MAVRLLGGVVILNQQQVGRQAALAWLRQAGRQAGMTAVHVRSLPPALLPAPPSAHSCPVAGKTKLQGFFVGAVMKESKGRANPAELNRILMERLNAPPS